MPKPEEEMNRRLPRNKACQEKVPMMKETSAPKSQFVNRYTGNLCDNYTPEEDRRYNQTHASGIAKKQMAVEDDSCRKNPKTKEGLQLRYKKLVRRLHKVKKNGGDIVNIKRKISEVRERLGYEKVNF